MMKKIIIFVKKNKKILIHIIFICKKKKLHETKKETQNFKFLL